jgi:hypothetical protein
MRAFVFLTATLLLAPASAAAEESPWRVPAEGSCQPSGGLRGWPIGEDAPPFAFEPGDVLEASRLSLLRNYLPPEIWEHRERFFHDGMQLEVGPCFRDYAPPAYFAEATDRFRGKARLDEGGGLHDHVAGLPFHPDDIDPADRRAGLRWAWNAEHRWQAAGFRGRFRVSDLLGRIGRAEPFEGDIFKALLAHRADRADEGYRVPKTDPRFWVAGGRFSGPPDAREFAWLQYRDLESQWKRGRSDDLHTYLPNLRKVRRAAAHDLEGMYMPSFAVGVELRVMGGAEVGVDGLGGVGAAPPSTIQTKRSGFEGLETRPLLYTYAALGLQDVLAPINATAASYPEAPDRSFGPWGLSWASDRWELRRAIVIDGTIHELDPELGVARVRTWVDLQTLYPLYYASYDRKGELIDVGYFVGRWSEDRSDYPRWPDDAEREVRVIDPVGAAFANLKMRGSWRRESWNVVSVPPNDKELLRSLSLRQLQKGR